MDFDMQKNLTLPVLPLRGLVVFPKSLIHFDVGRKKSITAINKAMKADQLVFLTSQKDAAINEPDIFDVYDTGVIAKVVQVLKQPENTTRIVIEGQCRATIINPVFDEKCLVAEVKPYEEESEYLTARDSALMRTVKNEFDKYLEISPKMPSDIIFKVALCKRPGELADFITANLILDYRVKQSILETFPESERLESVLDVLVNENFVLKLEDEISQKAKMMKISVIIFFVNRKEQSRKSSVKMIHRLTMLKTMSIKLRSLTLTKNLPTFFIKNVRNSAKCLMAVRKRL